MNRSGKLFFAGLIFVFMTHTGFSQVLSQPGDSLQEVGKENNYEVKQKEQVRKGTDGDQKGETGKNAGQQAVKRIKGSRPDMTRAKGARPPMITRPAGSGIPKGAGKPGGAGRHGGR